MSDENVLISEIIDNSFDDIASEIGPTGPQITASITIQSIV
jgi:hypothetical protein